MYFAHFLITVSCLPLVCRFQSYLSRSPTTSSICESGHEQSPIDIDREDLLEECGSLKFQIYSPSKPVESRLALQSNTLHIRTPLFYSMVESITMEGVGGIYISREVVIHLKSQHTVHREKFSAELQILHKLENLNKKQAWYQNLVVAVLLNETDDSQPAQTLIDEVDFKHPQAFMLSFTKTVFEKIEGKGFYHYQGSLSSGPCDENVLWYISEQILPIRQTHLAILKSMSKGKQNNRPVQKTHDRHVYLVNQTCNAHTFVSSIQDKSQPRVFVGLLAVIVGLYLFPL